MANDRNLTLAWLMRAATWNLGRPRFANLLVMTAATLLIVLGAEYE